MIDGNRIYVSVWPSRNVQCWVNFIIDIQKSITAALLLSDIVPTLTQRLTEYNARYVKDVHGLDYVEFDSEEFITFFILKWS